jgi:hypothetical protein
MNRRESGPRNLHCSSSTARRAPRGLMPVEQRQHTQVLGATGRLLRPDHVAEVGHDYLHLPNAKPMRVDHKLGASSGKA